MDGVKGDTVQSSKSPRKGGGLRARVLSSLVMMPAMLAAIWQGGVPFEALIVAMAAVLAWEWHGLLAPRARSLAAVAIAGVASCVAAAAFDMRFALGLAALAVLVAALAAASGRRGGELALLGFGPLYVGLPAVALLALRADFGFAATLWLFASVWATDIGAYAFGRTIGGPKLMPRVSPNKTWAGLLGGMLCAAAVGLVAAWVPELSATPWLALLLLGAGLAVVAQIGDLFESAIKRRQGAKDSSNLIPGHGGLLDRIDGVLAAAPAAVAVLTMIRAAGALE